ncbi:MAG: 5-formyltetrahydrofolate cyclo-ligase [Verrucomicrobia bacterium]|nr:5-formyltetrahydrofolate cyclo-ligase [Verrucomicrobiota bacterium]MBS0646706.1 5-formyltetrahydrofolate cyclo-ligase [Verrucomicrobiota bacterium]
MKEFWRQHLKQQRSLIPSLRRQQAEAALLSLLPKLESYPFVLSFASLPEEISTHSLNQHLANQGRLLLPKVEQDSLQIYLVTDLDKLKKSPLGILEPDPQLCPKATPSLILVPALGFDENLHRLGYGKGYYDKLLAQFIAIPKFGIGFVEQKIQILPHQAHDIAMNELFVF